MPVPLLSVWLTPRLRQCAHNFCREATLSSSLPTALTWSHTQCPVTSSKPLPPFVILCLCACLRTVTTTKKESYIPIEKPPWCPAQHTVIDAFPLAGDGSGQGQQPLVVAGITTLIVSFSGVLSLLFLPQFPGEQQAGISHLCRCCLTYT